MSDENFTKKDIVFSLVFKCDAEDTEEQLVTKLICFLREASDSDLRNYIEVEEC